MRYLYSFNIHHCPKQGNCILHDDTPLSFFYLFVEFRYDLFHFIRQIPHWQKTCNSTQIQYDHIHLFINPFAFSHWISWVLHVSVVVSPVWGMRSYGPLPSPYMWSSAFAPAFFHSINRATRPAATLGWSTRVIISNGGAFLGTETGINEGPKLVQRKSGRSISEADIVAAIATPPPAENPR